MNWLAVAEYALYAAICAGFGTWALAGAKHSYGEGNENTAWVLVFIAILNIGSCFVNLFFLKLILVTGSL